MTKNQPVIRVELRGGLGNQLFQAAAGYCVGKRVDGDLQFELFNYRTNTGREFALTPFQLSYTVVHTPRSFSHRMLRKAEKALTAFGWTYAPAWKSSTFHEKSYAFDPRILHINDSCYLRGYFQSWRYFESCSADIKAISTHKKPPPKPRKLLREP